MELDLSYPAISDLRARARRRVPHFAFEYLDSATGTEAGQRHNRDGLDAVRFLPAILRGEIAPDCSARFMDRDYALPVAMAPIGMAGSVWPGAEKILARAAAGRQQVTLLLFDGAGKRRQTLRGVAESAILEDAFRRHLTAEPAS